MRFNDTSDNKETTIENNELPEEIGRSESRDLCDNIAESESHELPDEVGVLTRGDNIWKNNSNKSDGVIEKLKSDNQPRIEFEKSDLYKRPTGWRAGMREQVWEKAKDLHGRVRDSQTGQYMSKNKPWDMGHKPGYEFRKHQESARNRGISREQFINEYYNPDHYRPELPSSNRSHKGEDKTSAYFGD